MREKAGLEDKPDWLEEIERFKRDKREAICFAERDTPVLLESILARTRF